jgi:hypothetical protein
MNLGIKKSDDFVGPLGWGSIFSAKLPASQDKGNVFLLLNGGSQSIAETKRELEEKYFQDRVNLFFSELSSTEEISALKKLVKSFFDKHALREEIIDICAILVLNNKLFIVRWGDIMVHFFRNNKFVKLVSDGSELVSVSGVLKEGDFVVVGSSGFFRKITPESVNTRLISKINSSENSEGFLDDLLRSVSYTPYLLIGSKIGEEVVDKMVIVNKGDYSKNVEINRFDYVERTSFGDRFRQLLNPFLKRNIHAGGDNYERTARSKKTAAFVGVILLLVLAISISFGIRKKAQQDIKNSYQSDLMTARHNLEEALSIYSLNPSRAREIFSQSRQIAENLSQRNIDDPDLESLQSEIAEHEGKILGRYKVDTQNFVDLGLLTDNFKGNKIILSNDLVYVVDKASRKIVKLTISSKRSEVLAGPSKIDDIYDVAGYVDRVFVFNGEGVTEVSGARQKVLDAEFNDSILVAAFSGNLYLLDKANSKILRFAGDGKVFGQGKDWLSSSVNLNLGSAKQMVIDGSIWVLMVDGRVYRFAQGNQQSFGFESEFIEDFRVDNIFTSDESQGLYVLDSEHNKIYVFTKEGKFVAEYISDNIKDTLSIVISEKDKKMLLLNGNVLLSMELKHLD